VLWAGAVLAVAAIVAPVSGCRKVSNDAADFDTARHNMVRGQIEARGISDARVLKAFETVERHRFVDSSLWGEAYNDYPLPIGEGQTISQPYIVALMTDLADIKPTDTVLEIGTGSGYQAAILGELADQVYSIEIIESLGRSADERLRGLGYDNIHVRIGDGYRGWPEAAPFDAIIITCAPPEIPQPLIDQLAEGGKMVVPVGTFYQELMLVEKKDGKIEKSRIAPVQFVPMTGESQKK
jgi:protein-L-isoaspartate(D-aspartate) O-methyltransferase